MSKTSSEVKVRYRARANDQINVLLPKGEREIWKAAAAANGKSINAMILDAVRLLYVDGYCDCTGKQRPQ